jgi:leader peptidase (prepilin peptidase) / N-methyltransferase
MPFDSESLQLLGFLVALSLLCGAVALIDIRRGIIPDGLNLFIAGLGLARIAIGSGAIAAIEVLGEAVAIGATFWLLRRLYFALRSRGSALATSSCWPQPHPGSVRPGFRCCC